MVYPCNDLLKTIDATRSNSSQLATLMEEHISNDHEPRRMGILDTKAFEEVHRVLNNRAEDQFAIKV